MRGSCAVVIQPGAGAHGAQLEHRECAPAASGRGASGRAPVRAVHYAHQQCERGRSGSSSSASSSATRQETVRRGDSGSMNRT